MSIFGMSYGLMTDLGLWFIADGRLYICSVLGIFAEYYPNLYTLHLTPYTLHSYIFPVNYGFITGSYLTFRFERLFLDGLISHLHYEITMRLP